MARFTADNTEGYSHADLDILNARFDAAMATVGIDDVDDIARKSHEDYIAQTILADFDTAIG
jgi:hypothetical protein